MSINIDNLYEQIEALQNRLKAREKDLEHCQIVINKLHNEIEAMQQMRLKVSKIILTAPRQHNYVLKITNVQQTPAGTIFWVQK